MDKGTTTAANRLRATLAEHGIDIRHSQAREIVARTFGFRTSNEMDSEGMEIPVAEDFGDASEYHLVAFRDPRSGGIFAMERTMLPDPEDRKAGRAIVSPYGGLLTLPAPHPDAGDRTAPAAEGGILHIIVTADGEDGYLYWSNEAGWSDPSDADLFKAERLTSLPTAGMTPGSVFTIPVLNGPGSWKLDFNERLHDGACREMEERPINPRPGIVFRNGHPVNMGADDRYLILADPTGEYEKFTAYVKSVQPALTAAGCDVYEEAGKRGLLIPSRYMEAAHSARTWRDAMEDLLLPTEGRDRIVARFNPQEWIRDNAVDVDPRGDTSIDITFEMLLMGREAALRLKDNSDASDELVDAVRTPEWIRSWTGPRTVHLEDAVEESDIL